MGTHEYLLLGIGTDYKEYRYCKDVEEVKKILDTEEPDNYDLIRHMENEWQTIIVVRKGRVIPDYDENLIPDDLISIVQSEK